MLQKYILFAVFATLVNISMQALSLAAYSGGYSLYIAMFFGTFTGLVLKYLLDKKFVFAHATTGLKQEGSTFTLYSLMGVLTTLVFWGVEAGFDHFIHQSWAKYLGAVVGLAIGYTIKFYLDKKFVFVGQKETV